MAYENDYRSEVERRAMEIQLDQEAHQLVRDRQAEAERIAHKKFMRKVYWISAIIIVVIVLAGQH
jgi:hypothetical protein